MSLLLAVVVASLVGSLHCAGMCGAIVACAVGLNDDRGRRGPSLHIAYHAGRLATYSLLGAVAGAIGSAVDLGGSLLGLRSISAFLAGFTIVVIGLGAMMHGRGVRIRSVPAPAFARNAFRRGVGVATRLPPVKRALLIGLLTTLLPCGWLYAFAIVAAGTSHPLSGAAVMAAFWVGTVPILSAVGVGLKAMTARVAAPVRVATAALVMVLGLWSMGSRLNVELTGTSVASPFEPAASAAELLESVHDAPHPCCSGHDQ